MARSAVEPLPSSLQRLLLVVHIVLAVLGYAALALTFCAGVMYLIKSVSSVEAARDVAEPFALALVLDELNAKALVLDCPPGRVITGWYGRRRCGLLSQLEHDIAAALAAWALYVLLLGGRYAG